jgi:hypothetical protein
VDVISTTALIPSEEKKSVEGGQVAADTTATRITYISKPLPARNVFCGLLYEAAKKKR